MLSIDTNLLVYAQNADCEEHPRARGFLSTCRDREIVICELVLVELYLVLRSAAIVSRPLGAEDAVEVCAAYRNNPRWRLVELAPVAGQQVELVLLGAHGPLEAAQGVAREQLLDAREPGEQLLAAVGDALAEGGGLGRDVVAAA